VVVADTPKVAHSKTAQFPKGKNAPLSESPAGIVADIVESAVNSVSPTLPEFLPIRIILF
jgi:hypothetical protein